MLVKLTTDSRDIALLHLYDKYNFHFGIVYLEWRYHQYIFENRVENTFEKSDSRLTPKIGNLKLSDN